MTNLDRAFNPETFLSTEGPGRQSMWFGKNQIVFAEGDEADALFVILKGQVRLSARSHGKKEAVLDILNAKDFVGNDCLAGERLRTESARTMTDCILLRIERKVMIRTLAREVSLSTRLCKYLLKQNLRYRRDLVDSRCNFSEKRLAHVLLCLANFDGKTEDDAVISNPTHETIAEMVGTTRSRVSFFMKRFRESGFIDYAHPREPLRIHRTLIAFEAE